MPDSSCVFTSHIEVFLLGIGYFRFTRIKCRSLTKLTFWRKSVKHITTIIASFACTSTLLAAEGPALSETQAALAASFSQLVDADDGSEAKLDLSYLVASEETLTKVVMQDALAEAGGVAEIYDFRVSELGVEDGDADGRLAEIASRISDLSNGWEAFFCSRFNDKPLAAACGYKTVDLLSALASDSYSRVFLATIDGLEYGTFRAAILYVVPSNSADWQESKAITRIYFDVIHEI